MWKIEKLVTEISARLPVGLPRNSAPSVSQPVFDQDQLVLVGDGAQPVPIGYAADQVGHQDRLGLWRNHFLDLVEIDLIGIEHHVDEHRHVPGMDDGGGIGREGQYRRDDLGPLGRADLRHRQH